MLVEVFQLYPLMKEPCIQFSFRNFAGKIYKTNLPHMTLEAKKDCKNIGRLVLWFQRVYVAILCDSNDNVQLENFQTWSNEAFVGDSYIF